MSLPLEDLSRFLEGAARLLPERTDRDRAAVPFVTISRQAGAGGRLLAEKMLERARTAKPASLFGGWALFDDRLADLVAENPALRVSLKGLWDETFASAIQDLASTWIAGLTPQSAVVGHLFKVVRGLASRGKVIIVGRAGACLTRHLAGGLHLRLVAPLESRIRRMKTVLGLSEKNAARAVVERDRSRAALVRNYFHHDINDPLLYDIVWNVDAVGVEVAASSSLRALEALARGGRPHAMSACAERAGI